MLRPLFILIIAIWAGGSTLAQDSLPNGEIETSELNQIELEPVPRLNATIPNPFYTEQGFLLGRIIRLGEEGNTLFRYRYEGEFMLGIGSIQGPIIDNICYSELVAQITSVSDANERAALIKEATAECTVAINPFPFSSFGSRLVNLFRLLDYGPVVLYYERPLIAPQSIITTTKNYMRGLWPTDPNYPLERTSIQGPGGLDRRFSPNRSIAEGRVVKALVVDPIRETFEIIVQLTSQGQQFLKLSVDATDVFNFIVDTMLTGKLIRIEYVQLSRVIWPFSWLRGYETHYRVDSVMILD